jgi:hypothetical protein
MSIALNPDGSMVGKTFSGDKYTGGYPHPNVGKETYEQYYQRIEKLSKEGFRKGDLSWSDWTTYLYGCPEGGGQYIQNYTIGRVPDHAWVTHEEKTSDSYDEEDFYYNDDDYGY